MLCVVYIFLSIFLSIFFSVLVKKKCVNFKEKELCVRLFVNSLVFRLALYFNLAQ